MKNHDFSIAERVLATAFLFVLSLAMTAQPLYVGSYNIRYQNDGDVRRGNGWEQRCPVVCGMMNFEQPDIFGIQEGLIGQLHDMHQMLDGYDYIGIGRDDGHNAGEHTAIFYRKERIKLLSEGTFWLSPTPEIPSKGWDAALPRICTWGLFKDKASGKRFYFFNLHLDHIGVTARQESAKLVVEKIREMAKGRPVVLTGDFNVDQHSDVYDLFTQSGILKDCYVCARQRFAETGTFNSFNPNTKTDSRIDHIFVSTGVDVTNYGLLTNSYWSEEPAAAPAQGQDASTAPAKPKQVRRCPSDHYPVMARLRF